MKLRAGEHLGFPDTATGRARARAFAEAFPEQVAVNPKKPRRVLLLTAFEVRPIGLPAGKIVTLPAARTPRSSLTYSE